jgi:hypothetical protein
VNFECDLVGRRRPDPLQPTLWPARSSINSELGHVARGVEGGTQLCEKGSTCTAHDAHTVRRECTDGVHRVHGCSMRARACIRASVHCVGVSRGEAQIDLRSRLARQPQCTAPEFAPSLQTIENSRIVPLARAKRNALVVVEHESANRISVAASRSGAAQFIVPPATACAAGAPLGARFCTWSTWSAVGDRASPARFP